MDDIYDKRAMRRLISRVFLVGDCWFYQGPLTGHSEHGAIGYRNKTIGAHRLSYMLFVGPIDDGLHVLHSCDNPSCFNPYHLRLGTHKENMWDKIKDGVRVPSMLSTLEIEAIKALAFAGVPHAQIATQFNIRTPAVSSIKTRM